MEEDGDGPVGVVGDPSGTVADALADRGRRVVAGERRAVLDADPDVIVARGSDSLIGLARARPGVPILPVEASAGVRAVPRSALEPALDRLFAGDWATERHPLLDVSIGTDTRALAVFDAMLVTAEPAHISEYTVSFDGERVARFRADGVVAATPAGTSGYARAAGAPVSPPGSGTLAVEPVAPFATTLDHWTLPLGPVSVTVEREEATIEVMADDRTVGTAGVDETVTLEPAGSITTVRVPEGRSPFARDGAELEKL
jgi:NAD+ kinase